MKTLLKLIPIGIAFLLASCGGSDNSTSSGSVDPEPSVDMRVMVVGDSICTGYGRATGFGNVLASRGYNVVAQHCRDGREAPEVAGAVGGWTAAAGATHVVILLGTNDAIRGSLPNAVQALSSMVRQANDQGAVAILGTLPPMTRDAGWNARAAQLSGSILGIGGARIADIRSGFSGAYLADGIHPNDVGQGYIADKFSAQLDK